MSTKETGGPAFPRPAVFTEVHGLASVEQDGMTLRDHFAGLAMQAYMQVTLKQYPTPGADSTWVAGPGYDRIADHAYQLADAMLEARK